ncbi:MAG: prolyl aminopeptidase [Myxococcales bacterium]|nr:prolyl aminopeptidase [Myxococcales bacterium]USN51203.1 MAG: prolyl aminopeptidase [Myxococcales bacterium]
MNTLFPPIEPFNHFHLQVSELHSIYVEEVGNPDGKPVIFVHGGPGGGIEEKHRCYFDPKKWRVILFDQRGCGKSTPFGELKENTTFDLVSDMERIREKLHIDAWHVFGGSWGSTLSLSYAITHPEMTKSLVLRGIFLVRKQEIDWFYQHGAGIYYPEEWEKFLEPIPKNERDDLVKAYHKRLNSSDSATIHRAAKAWSAWEGATSKLKKNPQMVESFSDEHFAYAFARIENHYFINNAFFKEDNWILNNAEKIKEIPGVIVQGRYDMPCPPVSAYELHKKWPKSELIIVEEAGHSASEPGITSALIAATNHFAS